MATTYRTQSANVLNDADSFERKLDWMLFAQEQDERLWSDPTDWVPGDDLFLHPRGIYRDCGCETHGSCEDCEGYVGNYTRPMIQEIEHGYFNCEGMSDYVRCEPCDTVWVGDDPCWVCGEDRPSSYEARVARLYGNQNQYYFGAEMRFNPVQFYRATERMQSAAGWLRGPMFIFSENEVRLALGLPARTEVVVETPPQETVECDEISFEFNVKDLYMDTHGSRSIDMPSNLNLSPRVRTPQVPRIEFSSTHPVIEAERYRLDRPITEQRRRRDL